MSSDISRELEQALKHIQPNYKSLIIALLDEIELRQERVLEVREKPSSSPLRVITNEHVQLKARIAELESKNETLNRECEAFKKERNKLLKQIEQTESAYRESQVQLKALENEVKACNEAYEEQEEQIRSLRKSFKFGKAG